MTTQGAFKVPAAATYCDVSTGRIREAIKAGELRPAYVDSDTRLTRRELDAWIESWPDQKP